MMSVVRNKSYLWNLKMIDPNPRVLVHWIHWLLLAMAAKEKELKSAFWVMSVDFILFSRWEEKGSKHSPKRFSESQNVASLYHLLLQVRGENIKSVSKLEKTLDKPEKKERREITLYPLVQQSLTF